MLKSKMLTPPKTPSQVLEYILYFLDYKMHHLPQIWEGNGDACYSLKNTVCMYRHRGNLKKWE